MRNSKHLKPKRKGGRSQLIASLEAAARRLARYAQRAAVDLSEPGASHSLYAYTRGLRELADQLRARSMTLRPSLRHTARPTRAELETY